MGAQAADATVEARTPAAERILVTASDLFFTRGIRAVGVDTIAAEAGITKMTLYKHFGSKDGLVAAHLRSKDERWQERWNNAIRRHEEPTERLLAVFDAYEDSLTEGDFRGCAFVNAAAELPDVDHPAREVVYEHKTRLRDRLADLAGEAGLTQPQDVADQLLLLLDGAFVTASIQKRPEPVRQAREMARRLIDDRVT